MANNASLKVDVSNDRHAACFVQSCSDCAADISTSTFRPCVTASQACQSTCAYASTASTVTLSGAPPSSVALINCSTDAAISSLCINVAICDS